MPFVDQMPDDYENRLNSAQTFFTFAFFVEMIITIIAIGVLPYMRNASHAFDGIIVITGLVEYWAGVCFSSFFLTVARLLADFFCLVLLFDCSRAPLD